MTAQARDEGAWVVTVGPGARARQPPNGLADAAAGRDRGQVVTACA
jgi:hypothetical protein